MKAWLRKLLDRLLYGPEVGGLAPTEESFRPGLSIGPKVPVARYILRPRDGVQFGPLPSSDGAHGDDIGWLRGHDDDGPLWVAVCSFCGGNCGQCGTSIGMGIPFDFNRIVESSGLWKGPPAGFGKR